ncbi:Calcium/calmodulin-dependent protein kinase type I [Ceratocystis fimbriata CBS 114723]|uniref:Calcium/calmodulin-dependent protein kinase type I n=1 Tax=Ceratocystis fimbriata CBS 114723 TaxID=1035309 RepID=A0A2C5X4I2_9PEZI|nr:Calcium/calmodulin-dependent protein kinase type I [Ceratocystis fimbriata CBS 114723]
MLRPLRTVAFNYQSAGIIQARYVRYKAFTADFDPADLQEAREWARKVTHETLPRGNIVFARSSGPGGQHVNKTESKAITSWPIHEIITLVPRLLRPKLRESKYYTERTDSLSFSAQTSRQRSSNVDENRTKLLAELMCMYESTVPGESDLSKTHKYDKVYQVGKTLGAGSYSVVKECFHIETGRNYAVKVINKRLMAGREHMVRNEIEILSRVSMGHQNILTLVDYFESMNNLYLVTDLALGGELFDRICRKGNYDESDASELIRSTLSAVSYLHDHGIVHRDLKPENLLFRTPEDNSDLLIADFGLSRVMDERKFHVLTTTCGTPGYMAPEIFRKSGHGKPVDIWAIGVITYFLLCGYTPFDRETDFEEMQAILNAEYKFEPAEYWNGVSEGAKDFIQQCLTIDPSKRPTAHEALQHPFVTGESQQGMQIHDRLHIIRRNFNARRTLHAAIDTIRAINKLREGQSLVMDARKNEAKATKARQISDSQPVPEDVEMGGNLDTAITMGSIDVPDILKPGKSANRVVETSKGLWGGAPVNSGRR